MYNYENDKTEMRRKEECRMAQEAYVFDDYARFRPVALPKQCKRKPLLFVRKMFKQKNRDMT